MKSFPAKGLQLWHKEFWIGVQHFLIILEQLTQRFINILLATLVLSAHKDANFQLYKGSVPTSFGVLILLVDSDLNFCESSFDISPTDIDAIAETD